MAKRLLSFYLIFYNNVSSRANPRFWPAFDKIEEFTWWIMNVQKQNVVVSITNYTFSVTEQLRV